MTRWMADLERHRTWILVVGGLLFATVCIRSAWMSDDAYITLRTIDNFVNGHGLRWNIAERVQTYTHPLWLILLTPIYALTREAFVTTLVVSHVLSILSVVSLPVLFRLRAAQVLFVLVALSGSKFYVDYSTSGLENPLTHVIFVFYAWLFSRFIGLEEKKVFQGLCLLAGLAILNRMDASLLILPSLGFAAVRIGGRHVVRSGLPAFAPLILWFVFSLVYYGFPFPNTAYAKLGSGIPRMDLLSQGISYLGSCWMHDWLSCVLIMGAFVVAAVRREPVGLTLAAGMILHLAYVVWIGGGFMVGRFLTGSLVFAVIVLARLRMNLSTWLAVAAAALVVSSLHHLSPFRVGESFGHTVYSRSGVLDERGMYYRRYGLLPAIERGHAPVFPPRITFAAKREPVVKGSIGVIGYAWGPQEHIIDPMGLGDPLLSRLPNHDLGSRIGHFRRAVPVGYVETIATGENRIRNPDVARYYEGIVSITRGDIWSGARWGDILAHNLGQRDYLLVGLRDAQERSYQSRSAAARGDTASAMDLLGAARVKDPENAEVARDLASLLRARGRTREAAPIIAQACSLRLERDDYFTELSAIAFALIQDGHTAEAIELYRSGIRLNSDYVAGLLNLGFWHLQQGDVEGADRYLARALAGSPTSAEAILAGLTRQNKDPRDLPGLQSVIPFSSESPAEWVLLYRLLTRIGLRAERWSAIQVAFGIHGLDDDVLGMIREEFHQLISEGDSEAAGTFLTPLLEIDSSHGLLYYYAGILHEALGQFDRAVLAHRHSVHLEPDQVLGREALERAVERLRARKP
ncbi:MAG: hypothetical protein CME19_22890 [Gemmatimonadetes bacterium]|nr:hypothetical protein [Gemmatimonadota bacterium]